MKTRFILSALESVSKELPEGTYYPTQIRMKLGMERYAWRNFALTTVYPEGSAGRRVLAKHGITIEKDSAFENDNGVTVFSSVFVKR